MSSIRGNGFEKGVDKDSCTRQANLEWIACDQRLVIPINRGTLK